MLHAYWSLCMPVPNMIKIFQTIKKLWNAQEFGLEIGLGQIKKKKKKKKKKNKAKSCPCMQHSCLTWSMSLSNYLKQYGSYSLHKILVLKGENYIKDSENCHMWHPIWSLSIPLPNIKIFQTIKNYGIHKILDLKKNRAKVILVLFALRFYGPVNPMGSCRARSVYLTTRLLGRLSPLSG